MSPKLDAALVRMKRWCKEQAEREAPFMALTAIACALACPFFTFLQGNIVRTPKDSSWPFCLFLTGLFLHLAAGWGFEYQSKWRHNRFLGQVAVAGCIPFWMAVMLYAQG